MNLPLRMAIPPADALTLGDARTHDVAPEAFEVLDVAPTQTAQLRELSVLRTPMAPQTEALRAIRSQLLLRWFGAYPSRTLAIVSPQPRDGRSWFAANMAVLLAQLGEPTLLIDADLRHPRQHEIFGCLNEQGLATALRDRRAAQVQRIVAADNLHVLCAGAAPTNPLELISGQRFAQLLQRCGDHFKYIVLDTPCADRYADAQTCVAVAGGFALLARRGVTSLGAARELATELVALKATCVGSILNDG